jgi:hypothetical protein
MTTIVSGFLSNSNTHRSVDKYYELGIKLLQINVPKIIFVDELMYEKIKSYENEFTRIILYDKTESYLYPYINSSCLTNFKINSTTPNKDTMEYMFIQCNKTEWIKTAIEINYFNTNQFVWIDFGIRHVITSDENLNKYVLNFQNKLFTKVRIGTIWDLDCVYNVNIYKQITWYFAGGVFGGDKYLLLTFSEKMKNMCLKIITERQTLMWETNMWYLIYQENKEMFDCYPSDHNDSILDNYYNYKLQITN